MCVTEREKAGGGADARLPQQLCHYVGGNYESDENGGGATGAKAWRLEREGKVSISFRAAATLSDFFLSSRLWGEVGR